MTGSGHRWIGHALAAAGLVLSILIKMVRSLWWPAHTRRVRSFAPPPTSPGWPGP